MATHTVTASGRTAIASMAATANAVMNRGGAAEFIYGEQNTTLTGIASMTTVATLTSYMGQGAVATGTASISVAYPAGVQKGDLILFVGGSKQYFNGFTNANFIRVGWSTEEVSYWWEDTPEHRTLWNNVLGVDAGPTRMEHHFRVATGALTGSETFTTGGTVNHSAVGQMLRFAKRGAEEWVVKSYGSWGNAGSSYPTNSNPTGTNVVVQAQIFGQSAYKLPGAPVIRGIAGDGQNVIVTGTTTWKSTTGYDWIQITHPLGAGEMVYKLGYNNGAWIAIGNSGKISRSTNGGLTWTVQNPIGANPGWRGLKYANGRWIVCGLGGYAVSSDDNGATWVYRNIPTSTQLNDIAWGHGKTTTNPAGWNNGQGIWWAVDTGWYFYRSNDNGDTWTYHNYYDTTLRDAGYFGNWDPSSLEYTGDDNFLAIGDVYSYESGYVTTDGQHYYWNYATYDAPNNAWKAGPTGDGYGGYGYISFQGDYVSGSYTWWQRWTRTTDMAVLHRRPDDLYYNLITATDTSNVHGTAGITNQQYEMSKKYVQLDDRAGVTRPWSMPTSGPWYDKYIGTEYGYVDEDTWVMVSGKDNGEIAIEDVGIWIETLNTGERPYYGSTLDIRDGDVIVVSISCSNTSDVLSNFNLFQIVNSSTVPIPPNSIVTVPMTFVPWKELSVATSTSGDRVKTYTGMFIAQGNLVPILWEDTTQPVGDSDRYQLTTPSLAFTFTAANPTQVRGNRQIVYTVLHTQTFGVKTKITASLTVEASVKKTGIMPGAPGSLYEAKMTVDSYVELNPVPAVIQMDYTASETSAASWNISFYGDYPDGTQAGALVVVFVSCDNLSATTPTISLSDTFGHTWTQIGYKGQNASAAAGVVTAMFYTILTTSIPYGPSSITVTFSGAVVCKQVYIRQWYGMSGTSVRNVVTASGSSATPTVTSGEVFSGDLVVVSMAVENATLPTSDTDTLNGSWNQNTYVTGSGGNALSHISGTSAFKQVTAAGAQTFNPATSPSTDWAAVIAVLSNAPTRYTAAVIRARGNLTADMTINVVLNTTTSLAAVSSLTADATVVEGAGLVVGTIIHASTLDMATGLRIAPATATRNVTASITATALIATTHIATVSMSAAVSYSITETHIQLETATVLPMIATANAIAYAGNLHDATVTMTAAVTMRPQGEYVNRGDNPDHPDEDVQPPIINPEPLPGSSGWHQFTSTYGPTGRIGNIVELTNRHYQEAYRATTDWPEFPFPNHPGGNYWWDYMTYPLGARSTAVTPLGNDRFLVTWAQENWIVYQESWYTPGVPLERILHDVPMILVATIVDCSADGDPVIKGTSRYNLPLQWRWYRNTRGQFATPAGNGDVICSFTGFMNIQDNFSMDHGTLTHLFNHSANVVCKIDASGNIPSFSWVKRMGGNWHGIETQGQKVMAHNGNAVVFRSGTSQSEVVKLSSGSGAFLSNSSAVSIDDDVVGLSSCFASGDTGYLYYTDGSLLKARNVDLNTLSIGSEYEVKYKGGGINIENLLRTTKQGPDGKWYAGAKLPSGPAYTILKMDIADGQLVVESMHFSDIANVDSFSTSGLTRGNAFGTIDSLETWVSPPLYPGQTLYAYEQRENFCPGIKNPTIIGVAPYVSTNAQLPEHQRGPQLVSQIPAVGDDGAPARASAWVSSPSGTTPSNWGTYFTEGDPMTVNDLDCAELSNGRILVVLGGVSEVREDGYAGLGNGIFRIFSYVVDPQNEPPPLKLAQRDDGKVVGGDRIAYDSENSGDIRLGRVAW